jgi:hypothetical protein
MKVYAENSMEFDEPEEQANLAMPDANFFLKNAIGAGVMQVVAAGLTTMLLSRNVVDTMLKAIRSEDLAAWLTASAGILLAAFLIGFPALLLIQSVMDYRTARDLERLGLMTRGVVVKKWVETSSNDKPLYFVTYKYLANLTASQAVDEAVFQQMQQGENIFVLYLEKFPHISRLDLD